MDQGEDSSGAGGGRQSGDAISGATGPAMTTTATHVALAASGDPLAAITGTDRAVAIRREHEAAQDAQGRAVQHALRCGDLLREAREHIAHGQWEMWVEESCKFSARTARAYMQLAGLDEANRQRVAEMSLRRALEDIAKESKALTAPAPVPIVPRKLPVIDIEADAVDVEAYTEPPSKSPPRAVGMQHARIAIGTLEQIKRYDIERAVAFATVRKWLRENDPWAPYLERNARKWRDGEPGSERRPPRTYSVKNLSTRDDTRAREFLYWLETTSPTALSDASEFIEWARDELARFAAQVAE
jgi:hypothetical protein